MKNYLVQQILNKYERSSVWKTNQNGNKSMTIQQKDYDMVQKLLRMGVYKGYGTTKEFFDAEDIYSGKEAILQEAKWLAKQGLVTIKWYSVGNDIQKISYCLCQIPKFYEIAERKSKFDKIAKKRKQLQEYYDQIHSEWIKQYYENRIIELEKGEEKETEELDSLLFRCLFAIEQLETPMYLRTFSSQYLGGSKIFEQQLKGKVFAIAKKYHPQVEEDMEDYQIYGQLFLDTYSQELALKGGLILLLDGKEIDLSVFTSGLILNSETLKRAEPAKKQTIKKIVSVENKANFVSMPYEKNTLLLFSHGYFSPLEKEFLRKLEQVLGNSAEYFHTGDLDYGGIRIFRYIRTQIFPKLQPYQMSVEQFQKYEAVATDMEQSVLEKLRELKEPLLQDLIDVLCEKRKGIEQENFL